MFGAGGGVSWWSHHDRDYIYTAHELAWRGHSGALADAAYAAASGVYTVQVHHLRGPVDVIALWTCLGTLGGT